MLVLYQTELHPGFAGEYSTAGRRFPIPPGTAVKEVRGSSQPIRDGISYPLRFCRRVGPARAKPTSPGLRRVQSVVDRCSAGCGPWRAFGMKVLLIGNG